MRMVHLPDRLALALQDVVSAVQQGLADAQLRAHLPMVSRRFMAHGVHIYYRCLSGRSAGARYAAAAIPAEHLDRARRVVVIADISLDGHWQGLGFFKALIAELCEPRQDIDLVEVKTSPTRAWRGTWHVLAGTRATVWLQAAPGSRPLRWRAIPQRSRRR